MNSKTSILIVDDEPDLLYNIGLTLEAAGYQVFKAGNGAEALVLLQTQAVELIISDFDMPLMDGYTLLREIRKNFKWREIPFLILTGQPSEYTVGCGQALGIDAYLTKPIRSRELLSVVETHCAPAGKSLIR